MNLQPCTQAYWQYTVDIAVKTRENMKLRGRPGSGSKNQGNESNYSGSSRDKMK